MSILFHFLYVVQLFEPFGDIEFIDLHRDPLTNKCKGFAFIQFRLGKDAKEALRKMNGFAINGKVIKVGIANEGVRPSPAGGQTLANELEEEANSQFLHSSESRAVLMAKLTRNNAESSSN
jgi:RNA recognition motif-containing protein